MNSFSKYDLSSQNTFRMKVLCERYIEYSSPEELRTIDFDSLPKPVISIGEGSNLLFTGTEFPGTVLRSRVDYIKYFDVGADKVPVAVGAGVRWDDFVAKTCADGLWGAENLSLIPGTVGGAAVQNIGAYGVEFKDIVSGVTCYDTLTREKTAFKASDCGYGYRDSVFKSPESKGRYIVTGVLFTLSRKPCPRTEYGSLRDVDAVSPQAVRDAVIGIRREKLPAVEQLGSAGSFFKNPVVSAEVFAAAVKGYDSVPHFVLPGGLVKIPAAWLIEQCALKGASVGGAAVYAKQPLVIVNASGDCPASDILALESLIVSTVADRFGIELHPEVEHI